MMLSLLCLSVLLFDSEKTATLSTIKSFPLPEDKDQYLSTPYDMDFSDSGKLFVVDVNNNNVMYWDASGKCLGTFGRQGQGPGELANPFRVKTCGEEVFVLNRNSRVSVFDTSGQFKRSFDLPQMTRSFGVINSDLILVYHWIVTGPSDFRVRFSLFNGKGELVKELMTKANTMFLSPVEGNNNAQVKAYPGDGDIQYDGKGTWYYGYGAEPKLYRMDTTGKELEPINFSMATAPPSPEDIEVMNKMSVPGPGGARLTLKDLPNLKVHFDQDKEYFCQFMVMGEKVVFVLNPIGGTNGVGIGFNNCTYQVCNLKDGKAVKAGRYTYPEDDAVVFNHGRAIGFLVNEDDSFAPVELGF